jgi:putative effector of murein hydrolase/putative effector of murein hydrolase LrgA (UPF0299 family)
VTLLPGVLALLGCLLAGQGLLDHAGAPIRGPVAVLLLVLLARGLLIRTRPRLDARLEGWLGPGAAWLLRWMPLFFVPPVVDLAQQPVPAPGLVLRALLVLTLGWLAVLGLVARLARGPAERAAALPVAQDAPRPPPLLMILALTGLAVASALWPIVPPVAPLAAVIAGYLAGQRLPRPVRTWLHPLLVASLAAWTCLRAPGLPPSAWTGAREVLLTLLGASVLALAWPLVARRQWLSSQARVLARTLLPAAMVSLLGTALAVRALGLPPAWGRALLVRSVTSAVAMPMAVQLQTDPALAASGVLVTGLLAALLGRPLLDRWGIRGPLARGLALGASGHALATAALTGPEPDAAAVAAVAMTVHGLVSALALDVPGVLAGLGSLTG